MTLLRMGQPYSGSKTPPKRTCIIMTRPRFMLVLLVCGLCVRSGFGFLPATLTTTTTTSFSFRTPLRTPSSTRLTTTALHARSSDRAHLERHLEDAMGENWREFRARLVAQEQSDSGVPVVPSSSSSSSSSSSHHRTPGNKNDAQLQKQSQLSDLFANTISSIFSSSSSNQSQNQNKNSGQHLRPQESGLSHDASLDDAVSTTEPNIFDGATIGGASTTSSSTTTTTISSSRDPFLSAAEWPTAPPDVYRPPVTIDKRRWAHALPHVEAGSVLLANEKLGGVFHQTVVLMIQHCESAGSIGIVINRPHDGNLLQVASKSSAGKGSRSIAGSMDLSLKMAFSESPVTYGGPVMPEEFAILHGFGAVEGATKLCPGVYVGGSQELMSEVRLQRLHPRDCLFCQGHAAWVPGQLSKEIAKGVWYTAAVSPDFILRYAGKLEDAAANAATTETAAETYPHDLWSDILSCMGHPYADVARVHQQDRGDRRMP